MISTRQAAVIFVPLLVLLVAGVILVRTHVADVPGSPPIEPAASLRPGVAVPVGSATPTPTLMPQPSAAPTPGA